MCLSLNCLAGFRAGYAGIVQMLIGRLTGSWLAIFLLLLFFLLLLSLPFEWLDNLDTRLFCRINQGTKHRRWLDRVMWGVTQPGGVIGVLGMMLALFLNHLGEMAKLVLISDVSLTVVVELTKRLTRRVRPYLHLENTRTIGRHEPNKSFPSGHTCTAFLLAVLLRQAVAPGVAGSTGIFLAAGLVGFSRIYIGMHYPRDVAAGAALGSLWGMAMIILAGV